MSKHIFSACPIYDREDIPFDPKDYSKFKHGSKTVAREFGKILAKRFWVQVLRHDPPDKPIVVYPSPYNFVPTAAFVLKDYFVRYLNEHLTNAGYPPVKEGKIYRNASYIQDYGAMNEIDRDNALVDDPFHIDPVFAEGKILLFLDDIKITGSHERRIDRMVADYKLDNKCYYLYYASVEDPSIEPSFENELNYAAIHSLIDVSKIIRNEEFGFNTRVVKFILKVDHEEFKTFTSYQSDTFLDNLIHWAVGNSYHLTPEYKQNFIHLQTLVN